MVTTQNQVYGMSKADKKSVDEIELTQNQVYGANVANTDEIELTQNQVYGVSMTDRCGLY